MSEIHHSICRACSNHCAIKVEVEDGRVLSVKGDPENPLFKGYSCLKGRSQSEYLRSPDRIMHSLKRNADGAFDKIPVAQAMDEIAARIIDIRACYGPRSVATFTGTMAYGAFPVALPMMTHLMETLGSPMRFDTNTIDKGGKITAEVMHGRWMAPAYGFDDPDVTMLIGINPMITHTGLPMGNPGQWLKDQARRGMKLIVIDPRVTDVAARADIHLQAQPGYDADILAAMIRVILEEGLYDRDFVAENVAGMEVLRRHVEPFSIAAVAARTGLAPDQLLGAARTLAAAPRGYIMAGTGTHFSGPSTLSEYLILNLQSLCGWWLRAGDRMRAAPCLIPVPTLKAQATKPDDVWAFGEKIRVRGLSQTKAGLPTGALIDEILTEGEGRIRALISFNGNPAIAFPDEAKTRAALEHLDLFVQIDPWMSRTAELADYIIAPTLPLEVPSHTQIVDWATLRKTGYGTAESYAQYTPAIVPPPPGSEVIEEWRFLHGLAKRLGSDGKVTSSMGVVVEVTEDCATDDYLARMTEGARIPLDELKRHPGGAIFPTDGIVVGPRDEGWTERFDLGAPEMMADLDRLAASGPDAEAGEVEFPMRLLCRRHRHVYNSNYNFEINNRGKAYNPAYLHPDDLAALGVEPGGLVEIRSVMGTMDAVADVDPGLRRGLVSMMFGFGPAPGDNRDVRQTGSNPNRLISNDKVFDRFTGQPRMSNVPVAVRAL